MSSKNRRQWVATWVATCMAAALAMVSMTACGPKTMLHDSYGLRYNAVFNAQVKEHVARDVAPLGGGEGRRIITSYFGTLEAGTGAAAPAAPAPSLGVTLRAH